MKQPETRVERRYNDFFWLQSHLSALHPECVIPPLPEKTGVMGTMGSTFRHFCSILRSDSKIFVLLLDKFSPEFLEYRRRELERFLRRVGTHPVLARHPDVIAFLEANDEVRHMISYPLGCSRNLFLLKRFAILKQKTPEKPDPDSAPAAAPAAAAPPAGSGGFANSLSSFWGSSFSARCSRYLKVTHHLLGI